jgi:biopolymer transport protein ExbD
MGTSSRNGKPSNPNINVTPLIDVLLVLLIIFMVITPIKPHKFETKVPEKLPEDSYPEALPNDLLVVTIDKERKINLNTEAISADELGIRVKEEIDKRPSDRRTIFIKAPKELPYGYIVGIIDRIKGAGANPIGLQVDYLDQI